MNCKMEGWMGFWGLKEENWGELRHPFDFN